MKLDFAVMIRMTSNICPSVVLSAASAVRLKVHGHDVNSLFRIEERSI